MIMNTITNNSVSGCLFARGYATPNEVRFSGNSVTTPTYSKRYGWKLEGSNVSNNITYTSVGGAYIVKDNIIPQKLIVAYSSSTTPNMYYTSPTTYTYTYLSSTQTVRLIQDHLLGNSPNTKLNGYSMGDFHAKAKLTADTFYGISLYFDSYADATTFQSETPKIEVEFDVINGTITNIVPHIENSVNIYVATASTINADFYIYEISAI